MDVLDDASVSNATLIGHSMGVQVALESYRHSPERVDRLVLVCGAPGGPLKNSPAAHLVERFLPKLRQSVGKAPGFVNSISRSLLRRKIAYTIATKIELNPELSNEEDFRPYLDGMARMDMMFFLNLLDRINEHDARDLLSQIDIPVLVIGGENDGLTPLSLSKEMALTIAGAELLVVEDGSHTSPLERPYLVNKSVLEFLSHNEEAFSAQ